MSPIAPSMSTRPSAKVAVWDLQTRLFHWLLVVLIGFSWWSAENDRVDLHIWSGTAILTLLIFRLLWGFVGGSTARFSSFVRGPGAVRSYLRQTSLWRTVGHTPLGALSVVALLLLVATQVALGLISVDEDGLHQGHLANLVSLETSEAARELHEFLFNVLLAFIILHVAAILYYRLARGQKLTKPMITGRAEVDPQTEPMRASKGWVAVLCLVVAIGITRWIVAGAPPFGG